MPADPHPHSPSEFAAGEVHVHKWWILVAVGVTLLMSAVDGTIVNVALPTLTRELGADFPTIQWVVISFLLGLTVLMLSMGRLGDMVGKKRVFTAGLIIFTLSSLLCGLAPGVYWLIGFRFVQAVGAAMVLALGVAIVTETWPAHERGKAIGISAGIISLGIAAGPALGGLILSALNWRWIFFVNLPVGLAALVMVQLYIPPLLPVRREGRFDYLGAGLIGLSLLCLSLALTVGQNLGFTAPPILALLALFVLTLAVFVRVEQRSPHPMIDLSLFRNAAFSLNLFTGYLTFLAIGGVVLLLPFYLELVQGLDQRQVGLLMAVVPLVLGVLGPLSGAMSDRFGTRPVSLVGLVFLLAGYIALGRLQVESTSSDFVRLLLPVGLGMGIFQSPNNAAIMGAAPRGRLGIASGILSMNRTLGQITGVALLGAYFASRLHFHSGQTIDVNSASAGHIVLAFHDLSIVAALAIGLGFALAVGRFWAELRASPAT